MGGFHDLRSSSFEYYLNIKTLDVSAYLRSRGWKTVDAIGDIATVWNIREDDGVIEIILPLDRELKDFASRMYEVLKNLSMVERRPISPIVEDISSNRVDILRFKPDHPDFQGGSMPVEQAVKFMAHIQQMLLSSACSAIEPRESYPTRKPDKANEYMSKVRFGQTERGSYVVTLRSPVSPELRTVQATLSGEVEDPFERRVVVRLIRALSEARNAAVDASETGDFEAFERRVHAGVNANLCDALSGVFNDLNIDLLHINTSWAPSRRPPKEVEGDITLPSDIAPLLTEAGRYFKRTAPQDNFEVKGIVVKLDRPDQDTPGMVTVDSVIDDDLRKVRLELDDVDYECAIQAHKDYSIIRCEGELQRRGRIYRLENPRKFRMVKNQDDIEL